MVQAAAVNGRGAPLSGIAPRMVRLITDADMDRLLDMPVAIDAVETVLRERAAGTAMSPLRQTVPIGEAALVLTSGGSTEARVAGLRVYPTGHGADEQLVAVWDMASGRLTAVFVGDQLGAVRTGAIGGAAIRLLSRPDSRVLAVIGPGRQGLTQLLAALAVRPIRDLRIYRRTFDLSRAQARDLSARLAVPVTAAETADEAVKDADIVVLATRSAEPVLRADWLKPGAHVNALGPKWRGRSEIGMDLVERASVLASDFPEQFADEGEFILHGTPHLERLQDLAALQVAPPRRGPDDVTLFLSHGLAGTEVAVARALAERAAAQDIGIEVEAGRPEPA